MLHRHGAEGAIRQAGDQGFPVSGTPEGGHHSPALGGGIQAAAVGQEVPPAHAGLGLAPPLTQQLHPFGRGEVHQPQAGIRQGIGKGEQALERKKLTEDRVHRPAAPQRFHPFAHKTLLGEGEIARGHQHRMGPGLPQAQAPLQQGQGWQGCGSRQSASPASELVGMGGQLPVLPPLAEGAPEQEPEGFGPGQIQALRPVSPGSGPGKQGHGAVAPEPGRIGQGGEGFGPAEPGILQNAVGINEGRAQPELGRLKLHGAPQARHHLQAARLPGHGVAQDRGQARAFQQHIGPSFGTVGALQQVHLPQQKGSGHRGRFRGRRLRCGRELPQGGR